MNSNCSNLLNLRKLQEQVKQDRKGFWPISARMGLYGILTLGYLSKLVWNLYYKFYIWCFIRFCLASNWSLFCLYLDTLLIIFEHAFVYILIFFCLHLYILLFTFIPGNFEIWHNFWLNGGQQQQQQKIKSLEALCEIALKNKNIAEIR